MLNETNITLYVTKVPMETVVSSFVEILKNATPILSVIATILLAYWTIKANYRNVLIQMYQPEIMKNLKKLAELIQLGDRENISKFIFSDNGVYIPKHLRNKLIKLLDKESSIILSIEIRKRMIDLINEYIYEYI